MPFKAEMGITRVANVTGLDRIGLPVVMVVRPHSRSVAVAQGKGLDLDSAKASGLMESVETWHAERLSLPVKYGSYADLNRGYPIVDIAELPKIKASQFHARRRMLWIEGRNLIDEQPLWLPYEMVHSDYTHPLPPGHGCFPASTNGLAAGNHLLEAKCHAICEVIERDATSVFHCLGQELQEQARIRLDTVDDPACRATLGHFDAAKISVAAWDTTTNVGVPSFYCVIFEGGDRPGHTGSGAGCHPSRSVAMLRALMEAAQTRLTYVAGSRDDLTPEEFTPRGLRKKRDGIGQLTAHQTSTRDFQEIPTRSLDSFELDLAWLIERLRVVGIEQIVAVDLTRTAVGIPVVRVVIPGLEAPHDDEDYVPGPRVTAAAEGRL
jgi:ribosomal protein S12 methylthiotransferase accessory factor